MLVHYKKGRGLRMLISGLILSVAHLYLISMGHNQPWLIIPCLLIAVMGILYLYRPYFELADKNLIVYSPLGFEARRYTFDSYADFEISGTRIYLHTHGTKKRVWISRMVANTPEWQRFIDRVTNNELTNELHDI